MTYWIIGDYLAGMVITMVLVFWAVRDVPELSWGHFDKVAILLILFWPLLWVSVLRDYIIFVSRDLFRRKSKRSPIE